MRKTLLILLLLCTKLAFAQLNDNFSDGNFTSNPVWGGNTANFFINGSGQLQSNGPNLANQNIGLSTPNLYAKNAVWEFSFQLNFNPTDANYPRVYLVSNQADLTSALQGYFFQIGEAGNNDGLHLYRQNGTSTTKIITGAAKTWASISVTSARIKITRDNDGKWELYADVAGGTNYTLEGSITDNNYTTTTHFGVNCRYGTASRYNQFIFDDFKITELIPDVTPPKVTAVKSINTKTIEVTFDEPVDVASAQLIANYSLSAGAGNPITAVMGSASNIVNLIYTNDFVSGEYTLTINNVADIKGNPIVTSVGKQFFYVEPYTAKRGDVVINEIMAAPSGTAVLNKEYFELYNTTDKYIIITGWKYKDAGATNFTTLGADTLAPKSYRILCANADVDQYKVYGKTLGISPWPTLNNDKDDLNLFLPDGTTVIDFVSYADTWYQDANKKTGYALELINSKSNCLGAPNWIASTANNQGTPGAQNSVYAALDLIAPKLISIDIISTTSIKIDFDKSIQIDALNLAGNYAINNGVGVAATAVSASAANKSVTLTFATPIVRGVESLLTVSNITSCAGIVINPANNTAKVFLAKEIKANDILITEILFNPKTDGYDFVEIYNNTDHVLDLKELTLSNPSASGTGSSKRIISSSSLYIQPKTYWVLTENPAVVKQQYNVSFENQMVQIAAMPAYSVASGTVKIWSGDIGIDEFSYTEKMHHALLKEVKGVSLERVSFAKSADEPGNLQSAAASIGFATPTYKNSQSEDTSVKSSVAVVNKTFSPDNDGFEDQLNIDYKFKENGNLATINIYTDRGVLVRKLARNITMSTQGTISWDGLNDGGQLCKVGIYVIKTDIFTINGTTDSFKQTCVLASKLN
ncbi:MAG: hypothetical protein EOP00_19840 [Pedobacter sp.]|nr:MAG: hypothetical protein EOP00_19840 [Pedobacter sp.]